MDSEELADYNYQRGIKRMEQYHQDSKISEQITFSNHLISKSSAASAPIVLDKKIHKFGGDEIYTKLAAWIKANPTIECIIHITCIRNPQSKKLGIMNNRGKFKEL